MESEEQWVQTNPTEQAICNVQHRFRDWKPSDPMLGFARAVGSEIERLMLAFSPPPGDDEVERVARALCTVRGENPDRMMGYANAGTEYAKATRPFLWETKTDLARAAIAAIPSRDDWRDIASAPSAMHVLAARFDESFGEWIYGVVLSPPSNPFTHWRPLPKAPSSSSGEVS